MSDKTSWEKARHWVFTGGGAVAFVLFMGFVDWRIGVKVDAAVDAAFVKNLGTNMKIVKMDTSIASNKRTGEENAEDIEQNRRADELAMRRIFGLPPPEDDEPE